jgi:hypothetical protein
MITGMRVIEKLLTGKQVKMEEFEEREGELPPPDLLVTHRV